MDNARQLLTRQEAAEQLQDWGYPIAEATLAKYATVGGGPPMTRFGRRPLYTVNDLFRWAASRCVLAKSSSDPGVSLPEADSLRSGGDDDR